MGNKSPGLIKILIDELKKKIMALGPITILHKVGKPKNKIARKLPLNFTAIILPFA